jgi:hypothetical protein
MDIEGIRFLTVNDKAGGLIDIRMFFTVNSGHMTAIYAFDKSSTKSQQATANQVIDDAIVLTKMKESVRIIGKDAVSPLVVSQRVAGSFDKLVPNGEGAAKILIGKVEKGRFAVRLSIEQKKGQDNLNLEVPFVGDPGSLKGKSFYGSAAFLTDGSQEVAKTKLHLYNIPDTR